MNVKQKAARAIRIKKNRMSLRKMLWGSIPSEKLWSRKRNDGFSTIPRTLPHIFQIMDDMAGKGKPVSSAYLALWARVFDESLVEIKSPSELAFESGFSGDRAVSTWKTRMKKLKELGFIDTKPGPSGDYHYVLIYSPYEVIKKYKDEDKISERLYIALFARAQEIGAVGDMISDSDDDDE